ncbi:hypothetical protein ACRQ1B_05285 [Rhizobium panacihumi]
MAKPPRNSDRPFRALQNRVVKDEAGMQQPRCGRASWRDGARQGYGPFTSGTPFFMEIHQLLRYNPSHGVCCVRHGFSETDGDFDQPSTEGVRPYVFIRIHRKNPFNLAPFSRQ